MADVTLHLIGESCDSIFMPENQYLDKGRAHLASSLELKAMGHETCFQ